MLNNINVENILFLDIETVPVTAEYEQLSDKFKKLWNNKAGNLKKEEGDTPKKLFHRAGIYSEFGKIICISVGFMKGLTFRIKSFYDDDEKKLLIDFSELLNKHYNKKQHFLCAHNGKEFDFNDATLESLKKNNYKLAFTTLNGVNTGNNDPYFVKRIGVSFFDNVYTIRFKIVIACLKGKNDHYNY